MCVFHLQRLVALTLPALTVPTVGATTAAATSASSDTNAWPVRINCPSDFLPALCVKSGEILGNVCATSLGTLVTTPLFDSDDSYIAYPPLTNIHNDLRIDMEFKPMDEDGLMFFIGGKKMKVEDFVALSLVGGYVEFRYELGTGGVIFVERQLDLFD